MIMREINDELPFIFPLKIVRRSELTVLQVQDRLSALSDDMVLIQMTTSLYEWQHFIVQRSRNERGYHKSVFTLSMAFFFVRAMLQRSYPSRSRNMNIFPAIFMEVGPTTIVVPVLETPVTLEHIFQRTMKMTCLEWLQKFVRVDGEPKFAPYDRTAPTLGPRAPYGDQSTLHVTDAGRESIASFPQDAVKRRILLKLSPNDFLRVRARLASSMGTILMLRYSFNAPFPSMQRTIDNMTYDCSYLLHSDWDHGEITATEPVQFAAFRVSPCVIYALGPALKGQCMMTMAVMAKVFAENIESMRSFIETLIGDELFHFGRRRTIQEFVDTRTILENKFLDLAPPKVPNTAPKVCEQWLLNFEKMLNDSREPLHQPIEAIPWF
jgi:hypothetical protein